MDLYCPSGNLYQLIAFLRGRSFDIPLARTAVRNCGSVYTRSAPFYSPTSESHGQSRVTVMLWFPKYSGMPAEYRSCAIPDWYCYSRVQQTGF